MMATIGIDLAKTVLHAVAMDAAGKVVQRRKLDRAKLLEWLANQGPCLIGMEACAGAHHLARRDLGPFRREWPLGSSVRKLNVNRGPADGQGSFSDGASIGSGRQATASSSAGVRSLGWFSCTLSVSGATATRDGWL